MNKNFGLREEEFNEMVVALQRNEMELFERIFLSHFKDCRSYLMREYNASADDAYDATMDTLLAFRRRLVEGKVKYGNLRFLFTRMAGQLYVKSQKAKTSEALTEITHRIADTYSSPDPNFIHLQNAWNELSLDCRRLLKDHYYGKMKLIEIALQEQKTDAAIRKQKERCIKKLRKLFVQHAKMYQDV